MIFRGNIWPIFLLNNILLIYFISQIVNISLQAFCEPVWTKIFTIHNSAQNFKRPLLLRKKIHNVDFAVYNSSQHGVPTFVNHCKPKNIE